MLRALIAVAVAAAMTTGCGPKTRTRIVPLPRQPAIPRPVGFTETGLASWYGDPYHGRQAANGEVYDMEKLTAAHRTLPFETWVRVQSLSNRKTVEVRITDRGPFIEGRIIDLSRAAARAIDMIGPGTAMVRMEIIRTPTAAQPATFAVQVGAFRERPNAERAREQMASRYGAARLVQRPGSPDIWRVLVGSESSEEAAGALAERIRAEIGEKNAFVVRLDS